MRASCSTALCWLGLVIACPVALLAGTGCDDDEAERALALEPSEPPTPPPPSGGAGGDLAAFLPQVPAPPGVEALAPGTVARLVAAQHPPAAAAPADDAPADDAPAAVPSSDRPAAAPPLPATPAPPAATGSPLRVAMATVSTAVVDRQPQGQSDRFPEGTRVHCFTSLVNEGGGQRRIRHRWMHGSEVKAQVKLTVKSRRWRTWSAIPVYGRGSWTVEIVDDAGRVMKSVPFTVD